MSKEQKQSRRGTPRAKGDLKPLQKKPVPKRDDTQEDPAHNGPFSPKAIFAFLVVALVCIGGFALWKRSQEPAPEPEEEEVVQTVSLDAQEEERVKRLMDDLTLEQKVAQLFIVTPEDLTGVGVAVAAGDATREAITKCPVGGICYFAQNLQNPTQTSDMLRNTQNYAKDACGLPLFMCVDEEGGTVARVADNAMFEVTNVGDMAKMGASGDVVKAQDAANYMGSYLTELGFNVDFAPVADIVTSSQSVMVQRSFGDNPELVSSMVTAQIEGFSRAGILCAAKHFPGIGDAEGDSHDQSIYSSQTEEDMLNWSCIPFKAAIDADVPMVMVSHMVCTGLEDTQESTDEQSAEADEATQQSLPACMDPRVIDGMLRNKLGYGGLVVTDSLQMGAVTTVCAPDEQAVLAIQAGADVVLMPKDFKKAYEGLLAAVKSGTISEERIDESLRRIVATKLSIGA